MCAIAAAFAVIAGFVSPAAFAQVTTPAPVTVLQNNGGTADGLIFCTQQGPAPGNGPVIIDNAGRAVWYLPLASGTAADFRVQTYQGQPVLTWTQGIGFDNLTPNSGVDYIYDTSYHKVAEVRAGNGLNSDLHEFELTPQGTALVTIYNLVPWDLSSIGGAANGKVIEGVVQEIDVASGAVRFEWHSLDHVAPDESIVGPPPSSFVAYDYFHINSIKLDVKGSWLDDLAPAPPPSH